jgi:Flp pilus assembly protein TadG
MSAHRVSSLQRILKDERGQMLPMVAVMLTVLLGFSGIVVDVGRAYVSYRQLQASTDASALAAAEALPDNTAATAAATTYGGATGGLNAVANLTNVAMVSGYPAYKCLTTLGLPCVAPASANAVVVKQTGTVKMTFGALVGFKNMTLTATATAAMRGSVAGPYNVAIVVDTTQSMTDNDNDSNCATTRITCALNGVQTMLQGLNPCAISGCGTVTNGNVAHPVDKVAIFTFPNVLTTTVNADYDCTTSSPTVEPYTFPSTTAVTYTPGTSTYQVVGYSSDYKSSNTATSLNSSSNIAGAIGAGPPIVTTVTRHGQTTTTSTPCTGMQAIGGEGTFFAGVIYAAQDSLVAAQVANPLAQNVMIILSDGNAGTTTNGALAGASTTSGTYPSTKDQCQQAITAAAAAKTAGTKVYTVAYGAEASGCGTDSPALTPCQTMQRMAYDASTFFSDYTATGSGTGSNACISGSRPTTNLNEIFTEISGDLTLARLIPDNTQ